MPLLTELGDPLLTENGQEFLAEDETGIPGQIGVRVRAKLKLAAQGALSGIANPISISGKATLQLAARSALSGTSGAFDWYGSIPINEVGSTPFRIVQEGPGGTPCFRSGAITDSGTSHARFIAPSAGIMTVWFKVSSESNYDWLTARKVGDPTDLFRISGETTWQNATVIMAAGEALDIRYTKDSSVFSGQDAGWITLSFEEDACKLSGKATLRLVSTGSLSGAAIAATPMPLQGRATLQMVSSGTLSRPKTLQGRATLRLIARNGTLAAPTGLAALMRVITDSVRPEVVLDQYLLVWFNGHPSQCEVSLALDEGTAFYPASTWMNSGTTGPAILKIDSAAIPGDGSTHKITVSVRVNSGGSTGPWATTAIYAKTPKPRTVDQPEWCEAVLLRQGGTGDSAPLLDLTRIRWRHDGAVKIMARIPVRTSNLMNWTTREIDLGYADYDESEFIAEGVGLRLEYLGGQFRNVEFGVCAIDRGSFGPVLWASSPVSIKELDPYYDRQHTETNQDRKNGPVPSLSYAQLKTTVTSAVQAQAPRWPGNGYFIATTALDKTLLAIKDIVRKGGDVTLDHLCRFEARWNAERTIRNVGCSLSAGFKEGTRQGRIMTDEEAKAA